MNGLSFAGFVRKLVKMGCDFFRACIKNKSRHLSTVFWRARVRVGFWATGQVVFLFFCSTLLPPAGLWCGAQNKPPVVYLGF